MKKNKMMRLASVLLVLTLLSTSVISGTFAKYTTQDSASDTARVAKWGVTVGATGETAFAEKYDDEASDSGTKVISSVLTTTNDAGESVEGQSVLAPGTNGDLGSITIAGTPEVMVNVSATADLTLTGWAIDGAVYCPLVFTVGTETFQIDSTITTTDALETAVENAITSALVKTNVAPNTNLADSIAFSWAWPFEGDDVKDTALGDAAATDNAPSISITVSATVTQVN